VALKTKRLIPLVVLVLLVLVPPHVVAQQAYVDTRILSVDFSSFPVVRVRAVPVLAGDGVATGLESNAFRVYENGVERPVVGVEGREVGVQVVIVLDMAGNLDLPGASGEDVRKEAIDCISDFVTTDHCIDQAERKDQLMLVAPRGTEDYQVLRDWGTDYGHIYNGAYLHLSEQPPAVTALHTMLVGSMARMKNVADYEQRPKFVVLLSDGIDRTSAEHITDVINRANALDIRILAVKLGPESKGDAQNLKRMASMTDGHYEAYTGPDVMTRIYEVITSLRMQYDVTYRSKIAHSGQQAISVGVVLDGQEYRSQDWQGGFDVEAPSVRITEPVSGQVYDRIAEQWDADVSSLEPRAQQVFIEVSFPDGYVRDITKVSYLVNGATRAELSKNEGYVWDFSELPEGDYSLEVEVEDELGLVGRSAPANVRVNIEIPPAPTPTLVPTLTPIEEVQEDLTPVNVVALGLAGVALFLAAFVFIKRPQVVRDVTETIVGAIKQATELFIGGRRRRGREARAYLLPLNDDDSIGKPKPIVSQSVNVGRDPARAQLVLDDSTVSRLHARIVEEADGHFVIYDEGSTSGTYVNDEPVPASGQSLSSGDEIGFGRVIYRFSTVQPETDGDSDTEAFNPPKGQETAPGPESGL